jgi:8-oxo-dGTP diphosphatase
MGTENNRQPTIGRFLGGVGALIVNPEDETYLLLKRAATKDFAPGAWECVTGRVDQGEGFETAVRREVREETGLEVTPAYILGTTHFHRGTAVPENELIGVVYLCPLTAPPPVHLSAEHDAFCWLTGAQALELLSDGAPTTRWTRRIIQRAETVRPLLPPRLLVQNRDWGFSLG